MKLHSILLIIILSLCVSQSSDAKAFYSENCKLLVNLNNAPFDSIYLHDYTIGRNIIIPGKKISKYTWEIVIPNEVVYNAENLQLLACPYDYKKNTQTLIRFISETRKHKSLIVNIGLEGKINYIFGNYIDSTILTGTGFKTKINGKDSSIVGDIVCRNFRLIIKDKNSDIAVRSYDPFFSWFLNAKKYETNLLSYVNLVKKYPNSKFLIYSLSNNLNLYRKKEDIQKVFKYFSYKQKNSIWGNKIKRFIYQNLFLNEKLLTRDSTLQDIVKDNSKYSLITFAASWCVPCINEIPVMKKLHHDLGQKLEFVYISIDENSTWQKFSDLMAENDISWRILYTYNDTRRVKNKYFVESIPYSILVYPDQKYEAVNISIENDKLKLYNLLHVVYNKAK